MTENDYKHTRFVVAGLLALFVALGVLVLLGTGHGEPLVAAVLLSAVFAGGSILSKIAERVYPDRKQP